MEFIPRITKNSYLRSPIPYISLFCGLCFAILVWFFNKKQFLNAGNFLFSDTGVFIFLADQVSKGKILYRDLAFLYGPLTFYPYYYFSKLFGNTPAGYLKFINCLSMLSLFLISRIFSRFLHLWQALFGTLLIIPFVFIPGGLVGASYYSPHIITERVLILSFLNFALLGEKKFFSKYAILAILVGCLEWVRFGVGLNLLMAWGFTELILTWYSVEKSKVSLLLKKYFYVGLLFSFFFATLIAFYAHFGGAEETARKVWPFFFLKHYSYYESFGKIPFGNFNFFLGHYFIPILGTAISIYFLIKKNKVEFMLIFSLLFFLTNFLLLNKLSWHFSHHLWIFVFAFFISLSYFPRTVQVMALFLAMLPFVANIVEIKRNSAQELMELNFRNKGILYSDKDSIYKYQSLNTLIAKHWDKAKDLTIFPLGVGFNYFYNYPYIHKNYFLAPAFLTAKEQKELINEITDKSIVVIDKVSSFKTIANTCPKFGDVFSRANCQDLYKRLEKAILLEF